MNKNVELESKKMRLEKLTEIRNVLEDLDEIKVIAVAGNRTFDITEFCPLEFSVTDMGEVLYNVEDAVEKARNDLGIMNGGSYNVQCEDDDTD